MYDQIADEINERLARLGKPGRVEYCECDGRKCLLYSEPHHLRTHERTRQTPIFTSDFPADASSFWNELAGYRFIGIPANHDYTSVSRQQRRRDALNQAANSLGYKTWSKLETAVINQEVKLVIQ